MLKTYFLVAFRNLRRNRGYAAINILGLAIGVAASLLIFLEVQYELSFDTFHKKKDRTYQVLSTFTTSQGQESNSGVPYPLPKALRTDHPELEEVTTIFAFDHTLISIPGVNNSLLKKFMESQGVIFAEPSFFNVFDFPLLSGNASTVLKDPSSAIITQETAERYFGDWQKAIGQTILYENKTLYRITGILKNPPHNTDFPLKVVFPYSSFAEANNNNDWSSTAGANMSYIVLPPDISMNAFNKKLAALNKKYKHPKDAARSSLILQPLSNLHFNEDVGNMAQRTFSRNVIRVISLIGAFLLVIACVNFINLATAQAVNRSKEVGVRKVMGSQRWQLINQFMCETFIITLAAVVLGSVITVAALPFVNNLLEVSLQLNIFSNPAILLYLATVTVMVTFLSGFYPALVISGFNPISALQNKKKMQQSGGLNLRRGLVIAQFVIAQALIIGTLVVLQQMKYIRTTSLGFDRDAVVNVPIPVNDSANRYKMDVLRDKLKQIPGVKQATLQYASPTELFGWRSRFIYDNITSDLGTTTAQLKWADEHYFETYNLKLLAGSIYPASDTVRGFVVNEALLRKVGVRDPQEALGKQLSFWGGNLKAPIVGVVRDFNIQSLKAPIEPVVLATRNQEYSLAGLKLQTADIAGTLAAVEKTWNDVYPEYVFEAKFLDEKVAFFYKLENQLSGLYKAFAVIAILISCLGLYGLVSFMATQRMKEVGVRKVLGASTGNIIYLFSKEFTLLIAVAFLIAAPLAGYFMQQWLQEFQFRTHLGLGVFLGAIIGSLGVAWVTVGYRAFKAASMNPSKSLRTE